MPSTTVTRYMVSLALPTCPRRLHHLDICNLVVPLSLFLDQSLAICDRIERSHRVIPPSNVAARREELDPSILCYGDLYSGTLSKSQPILSRGGEKTRSAGIIQRPLPQQVEASSTLIRSTSCWQSLLQSIDNNHAFFWLRISVF